MTELPKDPRLLYALLSGGVASWAIGKLWGIGSKSHEKLITAVDGLILAMTELKIEIRNLKEKMDIHRSDIQTMKGDLNEAHARIREIKSNPH
jgi:outer membrane murein-binding lipoprotein Lpp